MILALDKHAALHLFASTDDAQRELEAIDVQQGAFEFCDTTGQRYSPSYTTPPNVSRLGGVQIGTFKLTASGGLDPQLPERFVERAAHIEHTSIPTITSIEALRHELHKRA